MVAVAILRPARSAGSVLHVSGSIGPCRIDWAEGLKSVTRLAAFRPVKQTNNLASAPCISTMRVVLLRTNKA